MSSAVFKVGNQYALVPTKVNLLEEDLNHKKPALDRRDLPSIHEELPVLTRDKLLRRTIVPLDGSGLRSVDRHDKESNRQLP